MSKIQLAATELADLLRAHYGNNLVTVGVAGSTLVVFWRQGTRTEIESSFRGYLVREQEMGEPVAI